MKINDYIIRGGENLNSAPQKTLSFPSDAERIFNEWHSKLGASSPEFVGELRFREFAKLVI